MKKIISILLTLCMITALVLTVTPAVSAAGTVDFVLSAPATVGYGETFAVTLKIGENNTGFTGTAIKIAYDSSKFSYDKANGVSAKLFSTTTFGYQNDGTNDYATVVIGGVTEALTDTDSEIGTFYFTVLDTADSTPFTFNAVNYNIVSNNGVTVSPVGTTLASVAVSVSGAAPTVPADDAENYENDSGDITYSGTEEVQIVPDVTTLVSYYPEEVIPKTLVIPATVTAIEDEAIYDVFGDEDEVDIFIYGNPTISDVGCAIGYYKLSKKKAYELCSNVTIHGWTGSTVQDYCDSTGVAFEPLEEFKGIGTQNRTDGDGFRYIARMRYAFEYQKAKVVFTATGTDDDGGTVNKSKTVDIGVVYSSIKGTGKDDAVYTAVAVATGYKLAGVAVKNVPAQTTGSIEFTVETYVSNSIGGEDDYIKVDSQTFTYTAGAVVVA